MSDTNSLTRRRQRNVMLAALAIILTVMMLGFYLVDTKMDAPRIAKPKTVRITPPGSIDDRDAWRGVQASQGLQTQKELQDVRGELERLKRRDKDLSATSELEAKLANLTRQVERLERAESTTSSDAGSTNGSMHTGSGLNSPAYAPATGASEEVRTSQSAPVSRLEVVRLAQVSEPGTDNTKASAEQEKTEFIPTNAFVRVYMLNGVDAPTGGQAQQNPLPMFFELLDPFNLPNGYRLDYRKCRVMATAWGDLSSERAMGRIENMTCIMDGKTIEVALKGHVMGEDGKPGVRGRLVEKSGKAIAQAALAGIASGIGKAFSENQRRTIVSPLGATDFVDPKRLVQAGIGQGVASGLDRLVDVFLNAADKLFPIIEVEGGRVVELAITKGATYEGRAAFHEDYRQLLQRRSGSRL